MQPIIRDAGFAGVTSITTMMPTVMKDLMEQHEKLGSLTTVIPLVVMLGVAWGFYYARKEVFQTEGVFYIILVSFSFSAASISMHTLNKACVQLVGAPSILTTIQMAMAVIVTLACSHKEVFAADRKKLLRWTIVPIFYAGMLNSSLFGYKYLTLSLVTVFRNLSPMVTMTVEGFLMDKEHRPKVTVPVVMSLMVMVVGAVLFANQEVESTWLGLGLVTLNTLLAIGDRCIQRRLLVKECKDLPLSACMTLNNSLGMIPTFAMAIGMHEVQAFPAHHAAWTDPATLVLVALSGVMGMGIGFYGLMCQKAMTATSFQVLQNMSKVAVVGVGVFVFGDHMDSPAKIGGMALSLLGSAAYGLARASEAKEGAASLAAGEQQSLLTQKLGPLAAASQYFKLKMAGKGDEIVAKA